MNKYLFRYDSSYMKMTGMKTVFAFTTRVKSLRSKLYMIKYFCSLCSEDNKKSAY